MDIALTLEASKPNFANVRKKHDCRQTHVIQNVHDMWLSPQLCPTSVLCIVVCSKIVYWSSDQTHACNEQRGPRRNEKRNALNENNEHVLK